MPQSVPPARPSNAKEALAALRAGNERFVNNVRSVEAFATQAKREQLASGQSPYAILLSCSDSRAPGELIFDCGLGDLFVVRVAGNICAPSLVGSVEFAAATFGTQLVVVMGHTQCGAIKATLDVIASGNAAPSENIQDIVERIQPSIAEIAKSGGPKEKVLRDATRANVRATANHLRHGSRILEDCSAKGKLMVVGAEYALETGVVDFFDGV
jgi:carbonic anhydrase